MNFRLFSKFRLTRQLSTFAAAALILATRLLVFAPSGSSQPAPRPPAWSVQSTDPAHSLLTLKGSVIVGIDSGMFWVVQLRIEGSGGGQLAGFQPNTAVVLESPGSKPLAPLGALTAGKAQPQPGVAAKSATTGTVFTGIPTAGQTLMIQATGVSLVEGVVLSVTGPQTYTVGPPGPPCCAITAINLQTAIVTAKVNTNAQIFTFLAQGFAPAQPQTHEGPPPRPVPLVDTLTVGQPVWANLTTGQVSLDGKTPCCQMTSEGIPSLGGGGKLPAVGVKNAIATTPACCTITALYPSQQGPPGVGPGGQAGSVAAKVNSNGQVFVFVVDDITLFPSLKVGQAVWANFTTEQVSLDGKTPCCAIGAGGTPYSGAGVKPTPLGLKNPIVTSPACCEITALNQQSKTASAKVKSNGQAFQVAVANPVLFQSLRVGQAIWANFKTRQVSLNGVGPVDGLQITGSSITAGQVVAHVPGMKSTGRRRLTPQERKRMLAQARAILWAFHSALKDTGVRQATDLEIRRQLRQNKPLAFVRHYWVVPVDMSRVYAIPEVQAVMSSNLRGTSLAGQLQGPVAGGFSGNIGARLGLVFLTTSMVNQLGATAVQAAFAGLEASMKDFQSTLAAATLGELYGTTGDPMLDGLIDTGSDLLDFLEHNPATEPYVEGVADFLGDVVDAVTDPQHYNGKEIYSCDNDVGDCSDTGNHLQCDESGGCQQCDSSGSCSDLQPGGVGCDDDGCYENNSPAGGSICGGHFAGMSCISGTWAGWVGSGFVRTSLYASQLSQLIGLTGASMQQARAAGHLLPLTPAQPGQVTISVVSAGAADRLR